MNEKRHVLLFHKDIIKNTALVDYYTVKSLKKTVAILSNVQAEIGIKDPMKCQYLNGLIY